ncbi:unnamed protein product [Clonostachys solani]|uniref:FAD-binding FR-type domain-containing protein n=1 Tax=Clonostachys solani TaxID=160281 RepID=A0A9P0ENJ3_9HYPO|nr:unnamed protein product [Clonostachys solani]
MKDRLINLFARVGYQSQDISQSTTVPYWGYAVRVVPCANDAGTCEYFEAVYGGHERSMLYSGILWATIGGILLIWAILRHAYATPLAAAHTGSEKAPKARSTGFRIRRAIGAATRQYLLPQSLRSIFGRTTRLQILVLVIFTGYLTIWSFVGITYKAWRTPVKGYDNLYQTRSGLGPWSDRVGVIAYALTPFSVMLASRESILSQLTGIPYQNFNFLHRWLGYIIFVQSLLHTIGWTLIEAVYYQPQPQVANKWIAQLYMIWGCVAMILLLLLFVLSTPWAIRLTGYEFFRKSHYVLAMVYIGACWGHWEPLKAFLVPGLALWFVDRLIRAIRSGLIHYQFLPDGSMGFKTADAVATLFPDSENGDIVRLDYRHPQSPWNPGQHFYLCFTQASIWQSHPFTPLSLPVEKDGTVLHSYIFRAKKGETRKVAKQVASKLSTTEGNTAVTTPVVMQGPYGENLVSDLTPDVNVLCVAGGTGITYVLPVLLWLQRQAPSADRKISLVWAVRHHKDVEWVKPELEQLRSAASTHGLTISIFVTQDQETTSSQASDSEHSANEEKGSATRIRASRTDTHTSGRPDVGAVVPAFVNDVVRGRTVVVASGPGSMLSNIHTEVAKLNSGGKVYRGDERFDVELKCDDRLEW